MGLVSPVISSSQPLHEPASTSRIASARPKSRRARASTSWSSRTTSPPSPGRGSVARPTRKILENRRTSAAAGLSAQLAQHRLGADQVVVEDPAGHGQQLPQGGIADGVADDGALLAGLDDVLGPEHRQLLGHRRLVNAEDLLKLLHAPLSLDEKFEESDSQGVRQGLEEFCFEDLKLAHAGRWPHRRASIYEYSERRRNEYMA